MHSINIDIRTMCERTCCVSEPELSECELAHMYEKKFQCYKCEHNTAEVTTVFFE